MSINIAIDGPVASGKGAVTKGLAKKLGISALDTGAAYRAVTLFLLDNEIDIHDEKRILMTLNKIDLRIFSAQKPAKDSASRHLHRRRCPFPCPAGEVLRRPSGGRTDHGLAGSTFTCILLNYTYPSATS